MVLTELPIVELEEVDEGFREHLDHWYLLYSLWLSLTRLLGVYKSILIPLGSTLNGFVFELKDINMCNVNFC